MAINIEWQTLPSQNEAESLRLYPRMTDNETVDITSFSEKVAKYSIFTKGTVKGLIYDIADVMERLLHEGKTIDLEGLGTFKLSIGTDANVTSDTPYNKRPVMIRGINFQPSKTLMGDIGTPNFRTIPRNARLTAMSQEHIQNILLEYFKTHDSITRSQFEDLCKLKRTTAYVRLKALVDSGFLIKGGNNKETRYIVGTTKNKEIFNA